LGIITWTGHGGALRGVIAELLIAELTLEVDVTGLPRPSSLLRATTVANEGELGEDHLTAAVLVLVSSTGVAIRAMALPSAVPVGVEQLDCEADEGDLMPLDLADTGDAGDS